MLDLITNSRWTTILFTSPYSIWWMLSLIMRCYAVRSDLLLFLRSSLRNDDVSHTTVKLSRITLINSNWFWLMFLDFTSRLKVQFMFQSLKIICCRSCKKTLEKNPSKPKPFWVTRLCPSYRFAESVCDGFTLLRGRNSRLFLTSCLFYGETFSSSEATFLLTSISMT